MEHGTTKRRTEQMQPTGSAPAIGRISGCRYRAAPAADLRRSASIGQWRATIVFGIIAGEVSDGERVDP
jgi:hypothetical protein